MLKRSEGFTLLELVVVIAILAALAGIAIPRFQNANMSARGSKIIADMIACESAVNIYYTKTGNFPEDIDSLVSSYLASWPKPPIGSALVKKHDNNDLIIDVQATDYVYTKPAAGSELSIRVGRITLGGMTIEEILSTSEISLTLTDD
ncbi:hypothetical protein SDC9_78698 [bioreactor metagenome]|uniref:Type II secretion system protein G n=1 Tax=bioreactor metagenome TaxID=1076179 RepID=A0A644YUX2_9ZZZZ